MRYTHSALLDYMSTEGSMVMGGGSGGRADGMSSEGDMALVGRKSVDEHMLCPR